MSGPARPREPSAERKWGRLLLLVLALIVYGSLYP